MNAIIPITPNTLVEHMRAAEAALESTWTVEEAQTLHNAAQSFDHLCRIWKKDTLTINQALILRFKIERRIGTLLAEELQQGGSRYRQSTLRLYGINKNQSATWQHMAAHDEQDFIEFLNEFGDRRIIPIGLVYEFVRPETDPPTWDEDANWRMVRAVVRDFFERATNEEYLNKCADFLEE